MQATIRTKRNNISKIKPGNWITDINSIADFFVQDFRKRCTPATQGIFFPDILDYNIAPQINDILNYWYAYS